ncbi:hypothetical protein Q4S57_14345 [Priestia megaterium]|uniref:hypothetical protein n=1 Tax=Priestia megaterium TaxID=1404 RepID=UPI0026E28F67|nr:hypothetical protein [Priestia megaterium]MDO6849136.1 hypothetical protein [Priestia megaterium]
MQSSFVLFFIILGLLFGKWRRYQEYYPTLLFWVTGNLLYEVLLFHHRVWVFHPVGIDHLFLPDHLMGLPWNNLNYLSVCHTGIFRKAAAACKRQAVVDSFVGAFIYCD